MSLAGVICSTGGRYFLPWRSFYSVTSSRQTALGRLLSRRPRCQVLGWRMKYGKEWGGGAFHAWWKERTTRVPEDSKRGNCGRRGGRENAPGYGQERIGCRQC